MSDEAFARELYAAHGSALYRRALRLVGGDTQKAEDLVQETITRAWRRRGVFAIPPGRGWLFTVARNIAVDDFRASLSRPREVGLEIAEGIPAEDNTGRVLVAQALAQALGSLRPGQAAVLVESYYRGHSVAETAVTLGIPQGTVKSRTRAALLELRKALRERDVTVS